MTNANGKSNRRFFLYGLLILLAVGAVDGYQPAMGEDHAAPPALPEVQISGAAVRINGKALALPCSREQLTSLLGKPSRIEKGLAWDLLTWDELGIFAHQEESRGGVTSITFALAPFPAATYWPKSVYTGVMLVDGAKVTKDTSVAEINEKKKGRKFERTKLPNRWEIRYDKIVFHAAEPGDERYPQVPLFTVSLSAQLK